MKITGTIIFYNTPLDADYNNVFDSYNTLQEYENFLESYTHFSYIVTNTTRCLKTVNSDIILSVMYNADEIIDYNYCSIPYIDNNGNIIKLFYFITTIESENDSVLYPSCRIVLKYDAWTNNYLNHLKYSQIYSKVLQRTDTDYTIKSNNLYPLPIYTDERNVTSYILSNQRINFATKEATAKPQILWAKIKIINDGVRFYNNANSNQPIDPLFYVNNAYSMSYYIGYAPLLLVKELQDYNLTGNNILEGKIIFPYYVGNNVTNNFVINEFDKIKIQTEKAVDVELTFNAPVTYTLKLETDGTYTATITGNRYYPTFTTEQLSNCVLYPYAYNTPNDDTPIILRMDSSNGLQLPMPIIIDPGVTHSSYHLNIVNPDLLGKSNNLDDVLYNSDYKATSARALNYPYYYKSIDFNGQSCPIIADDVENLLYINHYVKSDGRSFIDIKISSPNKPLRCYKGQYSSSNGKGFVEYDSLEVFTRTNGNQIIAQAFLNAMKVNPLSPFSSAQSALVNAATFIAKVEDINTETNTLAGTGDASADIMYQDSIALVEHIPLDTIDYQSLLHQFHEQGYNINRDDNPIENRRATFDYVRTENCKLSTIPNLVHRKVIENALNNGMNRWHIFVDDVPFGEHLTHQNSGFNFRYFLKERMNNPDLVTFKYQYIGE